MTPWHQSCRLTCRLLLQAIRKRPYSTASTSTPERVEVRCASSGHITIDLFNVRRAASVTEPMIIHLPAFPGDNTTPRLPIFLQNRPVASINYRWSPYSKPSAANVPLHWPTPLHDTVFAWSWLLKHLSPSGENDRRDVYVYGSYLGATLATSLALTESYPDVRLGIRGLITYNGVYNWTMFLPDHKINTLSDETAKGPLPKPNEASHIYKIYQNMPTLFERAPNLFDPFASPSMFFHSPALLVPRSFTMTSKEAAEIEYMDFMDDMNSMYSMGGMGDMGGVGGMDGMELKPLRIPRLGHLEYPPRHSTLKLPETLIVYDSAPRSAGATAADKSNISSNSFQSQAIEFAEMMRVRGAEDTSTSDKSTILDHSLQTKAVGIAESPQRGGAEDTLTDSVTGSASRSVRLVDAGPETQSIEPGDTACKVISAWMENTINNE
ncbi:hypothetical protein E4U32_008208 [Claviceps aff. humidiphila group G2b]|nr:hypothetical protein E4U32_008208 [Claviceps aff. humidiphila group G2b]